MNRKLLIIIVGAVMILLFVSGVSGRDYADVPSEPVKEEIDMTQLEGAKIIYLAGGCFWGTEKFFQQFDGVLATEVGYANGSYADPTYMQVCKGSGHAETVKIAYDPGKISLSQLLDYYFMVINPTSVNRQGNDFGVQYRTGIYYEDEADLPEIRKVYDEKEREVGKKLAVEVLPLENYYTAEEYHQDYLIKNPGGYCHIPQKMFNLK